jgi:hypothetical protein
MSAHLTAQDLIRTADESKHVFLSPLDFAGNDKELALLA